MSCVVTLTRRNCPCLNVRHLLLICMPHLKLLYILVLCPSSFPQHLSIMTAIFTDFHPSQQLGLIVDGNMNTATTPSPRENNRKSIHYQESPPDMFLYHESNLRKYLPYNDEFDNPGDPNSSDQFRIYDFKVRLCTRSRSHDWTDCPFAHPGEKARRRDPRRYHYSGTVCPDFRRGGCSKGENCQFAHGVFECWLHPTRYRTEACKDGKDCKRKVCFFAHSPRQLRVLQVENNNNYKSSSIINRHHHQSSCLFSSHSNSPTSPLLGPMSPPLSPLKHRGHDINMYGFSRYSGDKFVGESCISPSTSGYNDVLSELMNSLVAIKLNESAAAAIKNNSNVAAIDISSSYNTGNTSTNEDEQQFILSPCTPSPCGSSYGVKRNDENEYGGPIDPDLGWVNDLLM